MFYDVFYFVHDETIVFVLRLYEQICETEIFLVTKYFRKS